MTIIFDSSFHYNRSLDPTIRFERGGIGVSGVMHSKLSLWKDENVFDGNGLTVYTMPGTYSITIRFIYSELFPGVTSDTSDKRWYRNYEMSELIDIN